MNFEQMPNPENTFEKNKSKNNLKMSLKKMEDNLIESHGDLSEESAVFYEQIRDVLEATLSEKNIANREDFLRALEYRKSNEGYIEAIDFIIKNTRD